MNWNTFIFATYEMILAVVFSLITVLITKFVLNKTLLKKDLETDADNLAVSIFGGTIILCILLLVSSSIAPAVDTLNVMVLTGKTITFKMMGTSFLYFLLFYLVALFFSIVLLFTALRIYVASTRRVDEAKELSKDNTAVSVLMSIVMIGITISVQPTLERFIFSLVNYNMTETIEEVDPNVEEMVIPKQKINPN